MRAAARVSGGIVWPFELVEQGIESVEHYIGDAFWYSRTGHLPPLWGINEWLVV